MICTALFLDFTTQNRWLLCHSRGTQNSKSWRNLFLLECSVMISLTNVFFLHQRSIGSDSQGRVTAANNQRQLAGENKKPFNFLPLHVNTNKSKELLPPSSSAPTTPAIAKEAKKQSPGLWDTLAPAFPIKETPGLSRSGIERGPLAHREYGRGETSIDSSQVIYIFNWIWDLCLVVSWITLCVVGSGFEQCCIISYRTPPLTQHMESTAELFFFFS